MTCTLTVLGCSGGIGGDLRTTSFLLDDDVLMDAGTGACDLPLEALRKINHIFLTHSHLDHIASVPFIADAVGASRDKPILVYGTTETLHAVKAHIFNDVIWPDFSRIPTIEAPFVRFMPIEIGQPIHLDGREILAIPVNHSIPANGYAIKSATGKTLVFSGDTGPSTVFWQAVNQINALEHLIIETSFNDAEEELAKISGHFAPRLLVEDLSKLQHKQTQLWISHLKPDGGDSIYREIITRLNTTSSQTASTPQKLTRGTQLRF